MPPDLVPREFPDSLAYLWKWFLSIYGRRSSSGFGAGPITWPDMAAYFDLHRLAPTSWELDLIERLDATAYAAMQPPKAGEAPQQASGPKLPVGKPHLRGKRKS